MLFSYKFFTFSRQFSQHPNKFYYRKFQNHSQIPIHRTNHSQIPTPHTTGTPIQPTIANSGNQKPQPPKHHYHTTTTTTKIKIIEREREREISGSKIDGLKARSKVRSSGTVRSARCYDWQDQCDLVRVIVGLELGVRRRCQRCDLGSLFFLSLFLSLSVWKPFEVKIGTEKNFIGQSFFFTVKWKWFSKNSIFKTNQTAYFTENDFLKPFTPKTNGS